MQIQKKAIFSGFLFLYPHLCTGHEISQRQKLSLLKSYFPKGTKSLTPDTLLLISLSKSNQIQQIRSQLIDQDNASLKALSRYDTRVYLEGGYVTSKNLPQPFSPQKVLESKQESASLSLTKTFKTATFVSAKIEALATDSEFLLSQNGQQGGAPISIADKETAFSVTLKQSLWQNAFGKGDSLQLEAAKLAPKATSLQVDYHTEQYTLKTLESYYDVWLAREQVLAAKRRLDAAKRLLNIIKKQYKIGTSEKPEYLEFKISYAKANHAFLESKDYFSQSWRSLVIALKLNLKILDIDPLLVPMQPDNFYLRAKSICRQYTISSAERFKTSQLESALERKKAALFMYHNAKDHFKPDLSFILATRANSRENNYGSSLSQSLSHKNPRIYAGLSFEYFFNKKAVQANALTHYKDYKIAQLAAEKVRSENKTKWVNLCHSLDLLVKKKALLKKSQKDLEEREKLQEKRFKLGRTSAFEMHRAQTSVTENLISYSRTDAKIKMVSWQLRALASDIKGHLKSVLGRAYR